jgi:hypothetical protein
MSIPYKILGRISDPEYYNEEAKRLNLKVRKVCNTRKLGQ